MVQDLGTKVSVLGLRNYRGTLNSVFKSRVRSLRGGVEEAGLGDHHAFDDVVVDIDPLERSDERQIRREPARPHT